MSTTTVSHSRASSSSTAKKIDSIAAVNGLSPSPKKPTLTKSKRTSLVPNNKPKSGREDVNNSVPSPGRSLQRATSKESSGEAAVIRPTTTRRPVVVEQFARPTVLNSRIKKKEKDKVGLVGGESDCEDLIAKLQSEVLSLKQELEESICFNLQLQSHNTKLSQDLAATQAKITSLTTTTKRELVAECSSGEACTTKMKLSAPLPLVGSSTRDVQTSRRIPECSSGGAPTPLPPPPPPPPLPRRAAAVNGKASSAVVELYQSLTRNGGNTMSLSRGSCNKPVVSSAHNSIVGEIQNRSAHLLAIKLDIETKGEFIEDLIQKVLVASYTDIEDVLKFVDWLDHQLSLLADERAVLKHFMWPEKKADAMREAAIEYRSLKLLEHEVSFYQDDVNTPYGIALKKMAGLLDKSERSTQRLILLRNSAMLSYQDHQIPTGWMLDSGIVSKIKKASIMLAKTFLKRTTAELKSFRYSERESTQEALLLQGVHFAYRAHQFSGGLDSETLCAFEEIRRHYPGLLGSPQVFSGISSS